jgi:hypothetical protein
MSSHTRTPAANVYRMMDRLGIDAAGGVIDQFSLVFACALRTCSACRDVGACRDWLAGAEPALAAPAFCPNVNLLFELRCRYPHVGTPPDRPLRH